MKNVIKKHLASQRDSTRHEAKRHIIAIYLFGSFANGSEKAKSDIDLAFVFNEKYYKIDPFRALQVAELLSVEISKNIKRPVDVVVLNGYSPGFAYYTVRKGICLYEKNTVARILYEVALENKYQDIMLFIKELTRKMHYKQAYVQKKLYQQHLCKAFDVQLNACF